MIWTNKELKEALELTEITTAISQGANQVKFNSKDIKSGDIFIAFSFGARDGHIFVLDALKAGANFAIVEKKILLEEQIKSSEDINLFTQSYINDRLVIVEDTMQALIKMANYKREKSKAIFIAITGSVGKTSTKEAITHILSAFGNIYSSQGNFNNHIGLPISLASMPQETDYAVFEMGMNKKGDIKYLTTIAKPNIAIITNISEAHIGFFSSLQEIAQAKAEIFSAVTKHKNLKGKIAIIDEDSSCANQLRNYAKLSDINDIFSFSQISKADCVLNHYEYDQNNNISLTYIVDKEKMNLVINSFMSKHYAKNFGAVILLIKLLNLDITKALEKIKNLETPKNRGNIIQISSADKSFNIICDHYNASPASMKAALSTIAEFNRQKKLIILGDMLELGAFSENLHRSLAPYVITSGAKKIILVGSEMLFLLNELNSILENSKVASNNISNSDIYHFSNSYELAEKIKDFIENEQMILIKGSRGIKLEIALNQIIAQ